MVKIKGERILVNGKRTTDGVEMNIPNIKRFRGKRTSHRRQTSDFDIGNPIAWVQVILGLMFLLGLLLILFAAAWKFVLVIIGSVVFLYMLDKLGRASEKKKIKMTIDKDEDLSELTVYELEGYENREAYLRALANENSISYQEVCMISSLLGEDQDFDDLPSALNDYVVMSGSR